MSTSLSRSTSTGNASSNTSSSQYESSENRTMTKWLPISMIALGTAAIGLPVVLLRQQRARSLYALAPPPRRAHATAAAAVLSIKGHATHPPPRRAVPSSPIRVRSTPVQVRIAVKTPTLAANASERDAVASAGPNDALMAFGAFASATALVIVGAMSAVWGIKTYMGVENTREFGDRMRVAVPRLLPTLSSRLHRPLEAAEHPDDALPSAPTDRRERGEDMSEEDWAAFERRLSEAWAREGPKGAMDVVTHELEMEAEEERRRALEERCSSSNEKR